MITLSCSAGDIPSVPDSTPSTSSVVISPESIALGVNQAVQFSVIVTLSDGSTAAPSLAWSATGGTVDTSGQYTAGTVTGTYQVIAATRDGVADTAVVTVAPAPPTLPPGIAIAPGQSIQGLVSAHPAGTTFIIKAGIHIRQSVIPKSGDRFIGEPGAVLDGQGVTPNAFSKGTPPYPSNVTISGLQITNYAPAFQGGAIDAGYSTSEGTTGWVIDSNEVSYNDEYGIRIGNSMQITNNNVHHNRRLNLGGSGNNTLIAGNEIAFGHYLNDFDTDFEAGGTKFTNTDGLVLRGNYVHDNVGVGLHMDLNNINTIIEGNLVDHNGSDGIVVEISYKTTIFNNTVTDNGWADPRNRYAFIWNAGIGIHASPNVEVYGNIVSGNYAGVVAIEQNRSKDPANFGPHLVQNLYVHDNIITQANLPRTVGALSVGAGIATDISGNTAIFATRKNRYVGNTYHLGQNPHPFTWEFGIRTEAEWKAYGQDVTGIFNR